MRWIGLAAVLRVSHLLVPLAGEAQETGTVHRIGYFLLPLIGENPWVYRNRFLRGGPLEPLRTRISSR
jgi:hypothetical protein